MNTRAQSPKRFYETAAAEPFADGWTVTLDGRGLKTPARAALMLPTCELATEIAKEWSAQGERIDLAGMTLTRLANVALDRTPEAREDMAEEIVRYCETDLLCHLAEAPHELVTAQTRLWAPVRDWAGEALGVHLVTTEGIIASPQPDASLDAARNYALSLDDFRLTALVFGAALFGSALLALAVVEEALDAEKAFDYSRLDEFFQAEQWGEDEEAKAAAESRRRDAAALGRWLNAMAG